MARRMLTTFSAPTRIIRFEDSEGVVHYGEEPAGGAKAGSVATVLDGDVFEGLTRSDTTAKVQRLLTPVAPTNILCVGLNYMRHWEEGAKKRGVALPENPVIFMKPTSSSNNPGAPIVVPKIIQGDRLDYEAELAIVIGKACKDVTEAEALDYVLGYTAGNDVSARYWQNNNGGNWGWGKSFDTLCPLGPVLVTTEEIGDPQQLAIEASLNGEVMQSSHTSDMIFSCARVVAWLSQDTTLLPGTVILTGTPEGVGYARDPPVWLTAGDEITVTIEGIGSLSNPIA